MEGVEVHLKAVLHAILSGSLVPFLGAGVNLCGRPEGAVGWKEGAFLPSGADLSQRLAKDFDFKPEWGDPRDLLRVCQFIATVLGTGPLFTDLHRCFNADYPFTPVHRFFAGLPARLRARGHEYRPMLIATTNYDDVMERAFHEAGEPVEVVTYICEGKQSGRFVHRRPDGDRVVIESPNEYASGVPTEHPVLLKLHGTVERHGLAPSGYRAAPDDESFVITEDHYIDYLVQAGSAGMIPVLILERLRLSHILFLGYGLRDWNLRVLLKRIWLEQAHSRRWWAVDPYAGFLEPEIWEQRGVKILQLRLEDYFARLTQMVEALAPPAMASSPAT